MKGHKLIENFTFVAGRIINPDYTIVRYTIQPPKHENMHIMLDGSQLIVVVFIVFHSKCK